MPTSNAVQIYGQAPHWAQTAALNLYGIRNRFRQGAWERILYRLEGTERLPHEEQVRLTRDRLRSLLLHALDHVPRYASLPRLRAGLRHVEGVFDALADWPVITRDEVLDQPDAFRSRAFRASSLVHTSTSGTTGTPFTTWMERRARLLSDALWWRRTVWAGHEKGDWIARLVGDRVVPLRRPEESEPWRISRIDHRIYLSTFHLRESTAASILNLLADRSPRFLMGYPSALAYLAGVALQRGWSPRRPLRAVLFSSEPMLEHHRTSSPGPSPRPSAASMAAPSASSRRRSARPGPITSAWSMDSWKGNSESCHRSRRPSSQACSTRRCRSSVSNSAIICSPFQEHRGAPAVARCR